MRNTYMTGQRRDAHSQHSCGTMPHPRKPDMDMQAPSRDFLALNTLDTRELMTLIEGAQDMARWWQARRMPQALAGRNVALPPPASWRHVSAFELGIKAMGGTCATVAPDWGDATQASSAGAVLGAWFDVIVAGAQQLPTLEALAQAAPCPVINAGTWRNQPLPVLADLAWHLHRHGRIDGIKVCAVMPDCARLQSWLEAAALLPIDVVQVYAAPWLALRPAPATRFRATSDVAELADADLIVTAPAPRDAERALLAGYRITPERLDGLRPDLDFIAVAEPAADTVDPAALAHKSCTGPAALAFGLHAQNALLEWVVGGL